MHRRSRALQPHILYENDVCITPLILFLLFEADSSIEHVFHFKKPKDWII